MHRIIDLTLSLQNGMRGVAIESRSRFAEHGWNSSTLHLYSHCGTHMDAQLHFEAGKETIDQVPLIRCIGPAWVIAMTDIAPKALISVGHLGPVQEALSPGESLLLYTGWSRRIGESAYRDALPRISEELAHWCVERKVKMLGVEAPSVADLHHWEELRRIHQILLRGGVTIVEGLTNLDQLRGGKVIFAALPLKIHEGDGSPVRALAIESTVVGEEILSGLFAG